MCEEDGLEDEQKYPWKKKKTLIEETPLIARRCRRH